MDYERWNQLMEDDDSRLTAEEIAAGWHFCPDWDDLLIGPGMPELESCACGDEDPRSMGWVGCDGLP